MMKQRRTTRRIGTALVATSLGLVALVAVPALVSATPPTGGASTTLLSQGRVRHTVSIKAAEGTDVVTAQNTFPAGSSTGWHSHPGLTVVTVQSGQITMYRERVAGGDCRTRTYHAGDTFFEWPIDQHNGVNQGTTTTTVYVTFFGVPAGGSARIERPDPSNC
jgi:quercetin dioxygenase-like cupin family protein